MFRMARSGSLWAPPSGSGTMASTTLSWRRSFAVSFKASAALGASLASRQRMAAQDSGLITEYQAFSRMRTRLATAMAKAPRFPLPPGSPSRRGPGGGSSAECSGR